MKKCNVVAVFLSELCQRLDRSKEVILEQGLLATDFEGQVRLVYEDGSYIHYQNAFLIKNSKEVGVFTEHCGYKLYQLGDFDDYVEDAPYAPVYPR